MARKDDSKKTPQQTRHTNARVRAELDPLATVLKFRMVRRERTREVAREVDHYSPDSGIDRRRVANAGSLR